MEWAEHVTDIQSHIGKWIERVLETKRWTAAELARRSGVSPSTISRAINGEKFTNTIATLSKISAAAKIALPPQLVGEGAGFAEAEAEPYTGDTSADVQQSDTVDRWQLRSRALEAVGCLPGDIVLVSRTASPRDGDIVHAQIYDMTGGAETVFRFYERPYITTRTSDPAHHRTPELVDDKRVVIMGVVTKLVRQRSE